MCFDNDRSQHFLLFFAHENVRQKSLKAPPIAQAAGEYDATFKRVDADGDAAISKVELEKADAKLSADFAKYDSNRHGRLSTAEFDAMMKAMKG